MNVMAKGDACHGCSSRPRRLHRCGELCKWAQNVHGLAADSTRGEFADEQWPHRLRGHAHYLRVGVAWSREGAKLGVVVVLGHPSRSAACQLT
ncbi:hypothetical protein K437DRAFT_117396 [Tilletiaria anomala UBC 951]|uniref:Uncharacterized protein n=1 Tax=Tilletiaria anomala (strain ATCC 24038 / CBS 436.72 / UBC 951) TaxID=1037660 RepID=A0A066WH39_TILAU|nr:uncharacterized protein K437DRAFT_117396 [Tilletiaria anomala UBC 951]KDN53146.1 hypothetical protein K437DRAFT_117396 [Tilletiaria anomala UBC 951]